MARLRACFAVCAVLLLIASVPCDGKKKKKNGLKIITLEAAAECEIKAKPGDKVRINYTGKLKDGTVFEDTVKIGRPGEFTIGEGNLIKGWEEGIPGMCVGEKRRLVIPSSMGYGDEGKEDGGIPGRATLSFDLELLAVNGRTGDFSINAGAPTPVDVSAPHLGTPFCDACHTFVEQFHEGWILHMEERRKKNDAIEQGGNTPPALTYNDDSEAFVQGFCGSKAIAGNFALAPHIRPACDRIMANSKREVVGEWLTAELSSKIVPDKKDKVCAVMNKACTAIPPAPKGECESCLATVEDLAFSVRRTRYAGKGMPKAEVYEVLDGLCLRSYYRHRKPERQVDACNDLLDEHTTAIAKLATAGAPWGRVRREVCVDLAGSCSAKDVGRWEAVYEPRAAGEGAKDEL